jgi:hypothetical protein
MLKNTEQFFKENNLLPIKKWKIASKSEKGLFYTVEELPNGKFVCDCIAGGMNKPCRHKRIVFNKIHNITKSEYTTL